MPRKDPVFLPWEDDIDFDTILRHYTEDENADEFKGLRNSDACLGRNIIAKNELNTKIYKTGIDF